MSLMVKLPVTLMVRLETTLGFLNTVILGTREFSSGLELIVGWRYLSLPFPAVLSVKKNPTQQGE